VKEIQHFFLTIMTLQRANPLVELFETIQARLEVYVWNLRGAFWLRSCVGPRHEVDFDLT
jgi:hypothetical protein